MADVLCERNDLDGALVHLKKGLDLMPWWGKADDFILAYITLARIRLAQGNKGDGQAAVEKAIELVQTTGVFSEARHAVEIAQVKLWLAQDDLQAASRWAASQEKHVRSDDPLRFEFENELTRIAQGRVLIAQNKPGEAIGLLSHLEEAARSAGRMGRVIEILLLEALAMRRIGDSGNASLALEECLALAEPEGYVRIFVDEGLPMASLLSEATTGGIVPDHISKLLAAFEAEEQPVLAGLAASPGKSEDESHEPPAAPPPGVQRLIEPLTPREREVLQLIAAGRSNPEVAAQLVVAVTTVKTHVKNIYGKLQVSNRFQAAARAKDLNLL
jgi:LuxR family transcriptional regulator, maltose regulon positive regulatory protein